MNSFSGQNLACVRGYVPVFTDLSYETAAGRVLLLTGGNGSGKTTLLRMMTGLLAPSAGEIQVFPPERVFWLSQDLPLRPRLSVQENLSFLLSVLGGGMDNIAEGMRQAGIADLGAYPVQYLSSGQKRRVMLALLSALPRRDIWVMDEPTTHLDTAGVEMLTGMLEGLIHRKGIAVIATHSPEIFPYGSILNVAAFSSRGSMVA